MYILVNAFKNIIRNKGRNWLLLILIILIISMSGISMVLKNYAKQSADYYTSTYGSKVSILTSKEPLDKNILLSFSNSKLLTKSEKYGVIKVAFQGNKVGEDQGNSQDTIKWFASSKKEIVTSFEIGEKKIIDGKKYSQPNEVIISKQLAQFNGLKVNDKITLTSFDGKQSIILKISGIYSNVALNMDDSHNGISDVNPSNDIYTSFKTMRNSSFASYADYSIELFLKNPTNINNLKEELIKKGMPTSYLLSQDLDTYEQKMRPIQQLETIAKKMMITIILVGGILLILISIMGIKERKYEVGVLRSMGMPKIKIARGFIYESVIITLMALTISICTTIMMTKPITNFIANKEMAGQADILLSLSNLQHLMMLSFTLVLISSVGGLFVIMRYEPRRILTS